MSPLISFQLFVCYLVHPRAWNSPCVPSLQDIRQLGESEADTKCFLHNQHSFHRTFGIHSVAGLSSCSFRQDADSFIVSNRVRADSCCFCQRPGAKASACTRWHHEHYQLWNAFQSQAVFQIVFARGIRSPQRKGRLRVLSQNSSNAAESSEKRCASSLCRCISD